MLVTATNKNDTRRQPMRLLIATALLAGASLTAFAAPASASPAYVNHEPYPWCAYYSGGRDGGGTTCGFVTWAQCQATISGIGGTCAPNPAYPDPADTSRAPRKHKHYYQG
jgi:hypothetical protein